MKYSLNWIQEFVDWKSAMSASELADAITVKVAEVEAVHDWNAILEHVTLGVVTDVKKHPDADALRLVTVSLGSASETVVCGGINVEPGMPVAFAKVGARVDWHGEGESTVLKKVKIRGIESAGMICAAEEIGLMDIFGAHIAQKEKEILNCRDFEEIVGLDFDWEAHVGEPIATVLGIDDIVLEVDNKTINHRADLWGQYGMAREISAIVDKPLRPYNALCADMSDVENGSLFVSVEHEDACPYYRATHMSIQGIQSRKDIVARLSVCGERSVHPTVDIANYVMLELGQPMHVFDADVTGNKLYVQSKKKGRCDCIGDISVEIDSSDTVITDGSRIHALAGVIGGKDSAVSEKTKNIILESAFFKSTGIRKTVSRTGIRTSASTRFEKELDPMYADMAVRRFLRLIQDAGVAYTVFDTVAVGSTARANPLKTVSVSYDWIRSRSGVDISDDAIAKTLTALGFAYTETDREYTIDIPSWRRMKDVSIREDILEEIIRHYGFDAIPRFTPYASLSQEAHDPAYAHIESARDFFTRDLGFEEMQTYSFSYSETLLTLGYDVDSLWNVHAPLNMEMSHMRPDLFPNLYDVLKKRGNDPIRAYEIGRVFPDMNVNSETNVPNQPYRLTAVVSGAGQTDAEHDFSKDAIYAARAYVEAFMKSVERIVEWKTEDPDVPWAHPGQYATGYVDDVKVCAVSGLHPRVEYSDAAHYAVITIDMDALVSTGTVDARVSNTQPYPSVKRAVSVRADMNTSVADIQQVLSKALRADESVDVSMEFIALYSDSEQEKTATWRVGFSHPEKTLRDSDVVDIWARMESAIAEAGWIVK